MEIKTFYKTKNSAQIGIFSSNAYLPRFHHHLEYELFYLDKGKGSFCIENSIVQVSAGDVIFIEPNIQHYFVKTSENYHYYAFVFEETVLGSEGDSVREILNKIKIASKLELTADLQHKIEIAAELEKQESFGKELQIKSILYEIFAYILETKQYVKFSEKELYIQPQAKAVQDACNYVQKNFQDKIDYPEIIKQTNYSKSQFIKLFKKQTGMNITDYINKIRIEHSCLELLKTEKSITEIATENGFNNIQYFSKKFKELMGCTPREYKINASDIMIPSSRKHIS